MQCPWRRTFVLLGMIAFMGVERNVERIVAAAQYQHARHWASEPARNATARVCPSLAVHTLVDDAVVERECERVLGRGRRLRIALWGVSPEFLRRAGGGASKWLVGILFNATRSATPYERDLHSPCARWTMDTDSASVRRSHRFVFAVRTVSPPRRACAPPTARPRRPYSSASSRAS